MGYKDKEKQREYDKERMRKVRQGRTEKETTQNVLPKPVLPEMVPAFGSLPERPRFLTLSDGQVLDRAQMPKGDVTLWPGWRIEALRRCNLANEMVPLKGKPEVLKVLRARYDYRGVENG